jgi:serine/threonine protein kinase
LDLPPELALDPDSSPPLILEARSYVAPELLLQQPYNTKIDIWSLGCVAIQLACGIRPFENYIPFKVDSFLNPFYLSN